MSKNSGQISSGSETKTQMLRGSAWLTIGSIVSRVLGAIYIIPWMIWMGSHAPEANALFAKGYNIYAVFLTISTAGIPGAVSKQVAYFNAKNQYQDSQRLFKKGFVLMIIFGIVSAGMLYFLAPILSVGDARGTIVLRSLSLPLLIIPILSIGRGYFQGYNDMRPSAISQVVEQIARVAYMLITTYLIMKVWQGWFVDAVAQSTFAAFIGAAAGIVLLIYYYYRQRKKFNEKIQYSLPLSDTSTNELLFTIVREALPFIIIDNGIMFYSLIDQYTFNPIMRLVGNFSASQLDAWYALFGLNANKLIMIIISLSVAIAATSIPLLSGLRAQKREDGISHELNNIIQLFIFVMFPSAFGMAAIAPNIYTVFYGYDQLGIAILQFSAIEAIVLAYFTILAAAMQGLYKNSMAIKYLLMGLVLKFIIQVPLTMSLKVFGPIVATFIAFLFTAILMRRYLTKNFALDFTFEKKRFLQIGSITLLMYMVVLLIVKTGNCLLPFENRFVSLLILSVASVVGMLIYVYLTLKTGLASKILGKRVNKIKKIIHIK